MKKLKTSLSRKELRALRRAYQPVWQGKEKVWLLNNNGEEFNREKEGTKFSASLKSKAVKQMEKELSQIYDS